MARQRRIEYGGAIYHVLARGDRREAIFLEDEDRKMFLETLGEACGQTGWKVHAWVLMDNHYHLVIETPEANLVDGMKWLQVTYTRRFNSRHKLWGHVFGGRYKSILCEDDSGGSSEHSYFLSLIDYVHLNPYRAGLVDPQKAKGLLTYPWCSLIQTYGVPQRKRKPWSTAEKVLHLFGGRDDAKTRRKYIGHLEKLCHQSEEDRAGISLPEKQTLNSTLQRGWYWGSQSFQDSLLKRLKSKGSPNQRTYRSSGIDKEHGDRQAQKILKHYLKAAKLTGKKLSTTPGSLPEKVFIAREIKRNTTVSLSWLAEHLHMKSPANVSQQIKRLNRNEIQEPKISRIDT